MRKIHWMICGLLFSCSQGGDSTRSAGDSSSQKESAETSSDSEDIDEELPVDIPVQVTGAYLVCTPTGAEDNADLKDYYGCGLRDDDKVKLEGDGIRLGLQISRITAEQTEVAIENLERDTDATPWHVIFRIGEADVVKTEKITAKLEYSGQSLSWESETFTEDDPDLLLELEQYRADTNKALEDIKDLADKI